MWIESAPKRDLINLSSPPPLSLSLSLSFSPPTLPSSLPSSISLSLSVSLLLHPSPSLNSCSPLQTGITQWRVHQRMGTDSVPRRYFTNLSSPPLSLSLCLCLQPQSIVDRNHPVGSSEDGDRLSPQKTHLQLDTVPEESSTDPDNPVSPEQFTFTPVMAQQFKNTLTSKSKA